MFRNIIIGQYVPGDSVLHRMDAKTKLVLTLLFIILLFCINSPLSYLIVTVMVLALTAASGVPWKFIARGMKPMVILLAVTVVLNMFMTPGDYLWSVDIGTFTLGITRQGVTTAFFMFLRLVYLVMGTSLLTLTTTPLMLTDGIEKILKPFERIKVPAHEIAMMMTIAIRFIPTLAEETDKIMKAQTARGADFESGNILRRAKAMLPLLVPLFVSAFRRADELATAMEARCYSGGRNRTKMKQTRAGRLDYTAAGVFAAVAAVIAVIEIVM